MPEDMDVNVIDKIIELKRAQWKGKVAYISNYPGLLDEVRKYTWTYAEGKHAYLVCSKLNVSLHKFVLQFLYGKEKLDEMIGQDNIIEHLDNNGLNCTYENLHVLSEDMNKAKAFSIDKKNAAIKDGKFVDIPALITDVYYSHAKGIFQLQVFFNKDVVFNKQTNKYVESFVFHYNDFDNLFIDWLYCFECIKREEFDVSKHHAIKVWTKDVVTIIPTDDEQDAPFVKRGGKWYLVIRTNPEKGPVTYVDHVAFKEVETDN